MDPLKIIVMVVVGAIAGTIAARIAKGTSYGIIVNALLGIAGAVVGGYLFNLLNINAGAGIVNIIYDTFGVQFPENIIGMIVSGTVGALIILYVSKMFKK